MNMKKFFLFFTASLILLNFVYAATWTQPVLIAGEPDIKYEKPVAVVGPNGVVYIVYKYRDQGSNLTEIFLKTYDGKKVGVLGDQPNVSDSPGWVSYEADLEITQDGRVHVGWTEYSRSNRHMLYIRYKYFDGGVWSETFTLGSLPAEDTEDLHMAVDSNNNPHIAFMVHPSAICYQASKYGDHIQMERFPGFGRSKHADVGVDDDFVHVTWQFNIGGRYTVQYAKRENKPGGQWVTTVGMVPRHNCGRPRMYLDQNNYPHVLYYEESVSGSAGRRLWHFYWNGETTVGRRSIMGDGYKLFHFMDMDIKNGAIAATVQDGSSTGGKAIYFNYQKGGNWQGHTTLPGMSKPTFQSVALTPNGETAVVVYQETNEQIYLIANGEISGGLEAEFVTHNMVFWGTDVTFDATQCTTLNPNHNIVSYEWNFGDGHTETTSNPAISHSFDIYGQEVRVTLKIRAGTGEEGTVYRNVYIHALYSGVITNVEAKRIRTLFYNRPAYFVQWTSNPKNEAAGYPAITRYEIWRAPISSIMYDNAYVLLAEVDTSVTSFLDYQGVQDNVQYVYSIRSVDAEGHVSPFDNQ